ncbi:hypothetical protein KO02_23125 [Sphingobacterium sp. ML3W]|nr:hypothetical protein KO02_23125 [Sphingobacterium sp. ML3W]
MYFSFLLLLLSCKNEPILSLEDKETNIKSIKADFEKKTGYQQTDSFFVNSSFKSVIDWNTFYEIGKDTLYVKIKVLDRLEVLVADSTRILLNDNVWIRGTRNGEEWKYSVLTFIPSSKAANYSGAIISKSVQSGAQNISFYESNVKVSREMVKKAGKAPAMPTNCVYGYINGYLNEISCSGGGSSGDENNSTYPGDPRDYQNFPPSGGGGGGTGGDGTVPTYNEVPDNPDKEIIDALQGFPCAQEVLAKLPNLENKISTWLNSVFKNSSDFNITFSVDASLAGTSTDGYHTSYGNLNKQTHNIKLNPDILKNSSQEYIAATMFHEALHGFLNNEKTKLLMEGKLHQFGILYPGWTSTTVGGRERFANDHSSLGTELVNLSQAIKSFSPNMSNYDAMAIAKGGIIINMDQVESGINKGHRKGESGTRCNK